MDLLQQTPMDLLITGFGPFPGMRHNPSEKLAQALARDGCWARLGWRVAAQVFAVSYRDVEQDIHAIWAKTPPRAVLMLGVASRAKTLRLEMLAHNRASLHYRDSAKAIPKVARLERHSETIRPVRALIAPMLGLLRGAHLPASLSRSAGTYLCNAAYWWMLGAMPKSVPVIFIHVPKPRVAGTRKSPKKPGASMANMTFGLKKVAQSLVLYRKIKAA